MDLPARLRDARRQPIAAGATVLAPCPHDRACPMPPDDWCHFAQRLNRARAHRAARGATRSYEDEKHAYVAAARHPGTPIAARIPRHPQIVPGRATRQLCTPDGLRTATVARSRDRAAFRAARDERWGDAIGSGKDRGAGAG